MNIFSRVTFKTMKENKVRTIVTIVGIILSAARFTAVTTFGSSLYAYLFRMQAEESGAHHIKMEYRDFEYTLSSGETRDRFDDVSEVANDKRVTKTAILQYTGYAEINSENEYKPYLFIGTVNDEFFDMMPVNLTKGRLPENESEIMLPEHLYENGRVKYELGEMLRLDVGKYYLDGYALNQGTMFDPGAQIETKDMQEKTYTVVGFYERPSFEGHTSPGYTALTKGDVVFEKGRECDLYMQIKFPGINAKKFKEINESVYLNYDILMFYGLSRYSNVTALIKGVLAIICSIIFAGSVSLIYNAFSISVSERTKQFGLLSSLGATKKQIKHSVLTEALAVSAIGIPIGILSGVLGIAVTLHFCGALFANILDSSYGVEFKATWWSIVLAVVIAFLTVLVAAVVPSKRATHVTAIEAIRQNKEIKSSKRDVRYSKAFVKIFGASGILAKKYYSRSRRKYRSTIISLAMSIILFISAGSFGMSITSAIEENDVTSSYDIIFNFSLNETGDINKILDKIRNINEIDDVWAYIQGNTGYAITNDSITTDSYKRLCEKYSSYLGDRFTGANEVVYPMMRIRYIDDASFKEILKANGLNEEEFFNKDDPKALLLNKGVLQVFEEDERSFNSYTLLNDSVDSLPVVINAYEDLDGYDDVGLYLDADGKCYRYYIDSTKNDNGEIQYDDYGRPVPDKKVLVEPTSIKIGGMVDEIKLIDTDNYSLMAELFCPMSVGVDEESAIKVNQDMADSGFVYYYQFDNSQGAYATSSNTEKAIEEYNKIMEESDGVEYYSAYDATEEERAVRSMAIVANVFAYGFIVLISLICVANVFNTITTNIALRRRDYAMLRSMGMTNKDIDRMMIYECLVYGTKSLIAGLPIGTVFSFLIYKVITESNFSLPNYTLPWLQMLIAGSVVFTVVFVSMIYAVRKIKKDNLMDVLKNENI